MIVAQSTKIHRLSTSAMVVWGPCFFDSYTTHLFQEFLHDDVALPLPIDGLEPAESPSIGRWALPSLTALRRLMRWVQQHPAEATAIGKAWRRNIQTVKKDSTGQR